MYIIIKLYGRIFGGIPKMLVLINMLFSQKTDGFRQTYSQGF